MSEANEEYTRRTGSAFPPVLDACCGGRCFWFDKHDKRAVYVDKRRETWQLDQRPGRSALNVCPDVQADFTALPFPSETFALVVFDPPHFVRNSDSGRNRKVYGFLSGDWKDMLRRGFAECFRVLRPEGVLVFKWAESSVTVGDILNLTPERPLFGHRSGKQSKTHWIAFLKPNVPVTRGGTPSRPAAGCASGLEAK